MNENDLIDKDSNDVSNFNYTLVKNKKDNDIISKKDKIDFLIKAVGLISLVISFLIYQNTINVQKRFNNDKKIQDYKDSIHSLRQSFDDNQKYAKEQIRLDRLLRLRQIEVDKTIRLKELEIQQSLDNSINSILLQNKLFLNKERISNQVDIYSITVSSMQSIISLNYNSLEYKNALDVLFNKCYPKIKLQNDDKIISLIDSFDLQLSYYELASEAKNYLDSIDLKSNRIETIIIENYIVNTEIKDENHENFTILNNTLVFDNVNYDKHINKMISDEKNLNRSVIYFTSLLSQCDKLIKQDPKNLNNKKLQLLKNYCLEYILLTKEFCRLLDGYISTKKVFKNKKLWGINMDVNKDYVMLEYKNFNKLYRDKIPTQKVARTTDEFREELYNISEKIILEMNQQNPVLKGYQK